MLTEYSLHVSSLTGGLCYKLLFLDEYNSAIFPKESALYLEEEEEEQKQIRITIAGS